MVLLWKLKILLLGISLWHSRLRIWHCCSCGTSCNCGTGSILGLGISTCHRHLPPQKNSTSRFPLYRNTTVFSILNFNPSITSLLKFFISSNRVCRLPCLFHAEQTILSMSNAGFFFPLCNPYVYFYFFFLPYSTAWDIKNNNVKKKW